VRTAIGDDAVIASPLHINDAEFARQAAETLLEMLDVPRQDRKE